MKKTVQIITVPLFKKGWSKGDIINDGKFTSIGIYSSEGFGNWQAQQLLVLSADEIQEGDCAYYDTGNIQPCNSALWGKKDAARCELDRKAYGDCKKIIASYPQIEGTLSISKETIQEWINAGTPGEGTVDTANICLQTGISCGYPCNGDCDEKAYKEYVYDPQGNLLLEFSEVRTEKEILKDLRYAETPERKDSFLQELHDIREKESKPSIPTDEEIREKGLSALKKEREVDDGEQLSAFEGRCLITGFYQGYKQALKDLGHE
jgi:hypothetical protein